LSEPSWYIVRPQGLGRIGLDVKTDIERAHENQAMFAKVAPRYDVMNRLMTGGMDGSWRHELITRAQITPEACVLDIGAGTGDIALEIAREFPSSRVVAGDYTFEMMWAGKSKGRDLPFHAADALHLPYAENTFDAVVSGFLLRNVTDIDAALREQYRVLRKGGRWVALDTTRPEKNLFSPFIQFHLQTVIPTLGRFISGQGNAYRYLTSSTQNFLQAEELAEQARRAGFGGVDFVRRNFGTIAIHWGKKE
jgi:demethylmenaquinone methyltransferase/2-methoxy-6-polyprenyl-1,4-benzoquinol methylase